MDEHETSPRGTGKDIGCALSIMKSRHVILGHLHDMIASHHLLLHTQCPVAHLMSRELLTVDL